MMVRETEQDPGVGYRVAIQTHPCRRRVVGRHAQMPRPTGVPPQARAAVPARARAARRGQSRCRHHGHRTCPRGTMGRYRESPYGRGIGTAREGRQSWAHRLGAAVQTRQARNRRPGLVVEVVVGPNVIVHPIQIRNPSPCPSPSPSRRVLRMQSGRGHCGVGSGRAKWARGGLGRWQRPAGRDGGASVALIPFVRVNAIAIASGPSLQGCQWNLGSRSGRGVILGSKWRQRPLE
ncbi:hypothetical protein BCR44DRAFT_1187328 [Catenaria anguillulae PL171]|uniref:Uncharacterized protein n=1 Tax=Catenaria anguillulae PL171 TaxID=765915 RepID=A0A1Y2HJ31_9FUNG|nr:hypothetical protein BCR44DRAFT_1187328 [Catenaria anguillulae PL171]